MDYKQRFARGEFFRCLYCGAKLGRATKWGLHVTCKRLQESAYIEKGEIRCEARRSREIENSICGAEYIINTEENAQILIQLKGK